MALILGIDPGFAALGFVLVQLAPSDLMRIEEVGLIRTQKSDTKRKVLAADDNFQRSREIAETLRVVVQMGAGVQAICAESMSYPRNAAAAAKVALCWGVLADITVCWNLPMVQVSPKEMKKAVCGSAGASKEEVAKSLDDMFGSRPREMLEAKKIPPSLWEHVYDALGVVVAGSKGEVLRIVRRVQ